MDGYLESKRPHTSFRYFFECLLQEKESVGIMAHAHYHPYYEILYCKSGMCELRLGEKIHCFQTGDMVLIDPMEVHNITALHEGRNAYIVLKFLPQLLHFAEQPTREVQYLLAYRRSVHTHRVLFSQHQLASTEIPQIIHALQYEAQTQTYGFEMAVRSQICRLFVWILRDWHGQNGANVQGISEERLACLVKALAYIDDHYAEPLTMMDVADHCGMPYTSFSRFFSHTMQKSFPEYLMKLRLRQSYILLATTEKSITHIAMDTGFSCTSYFIQSFRKTCGVTPLQYRQRFAETP